MDTDGRLCRLLMPPPSRCVGGVSVYARAGVSVGCALLSPTLKQSTERAHVLTRCMSDLQDTEQRAAGNNTTRQTSEEASWLDVRQRARALSSPQTPFEARVRATPSCKPCRTHDTAFEFPPAPIRVPNLSVTEKAACVALDYFTNGSQIRSRRPIA